MLRSTLFLLLLSPAVALAQVTTSVSGLSLTVPETDKVFRDCSHSVTVTWAANVQGLACSDLLLWSTTATTCGDKPANGDIPYRSIPQAELTSRRTNTFPVAVSGLPGFNATDGGSCGVQGVELQFRLCGAYTHSTLNCDTNSPVVHVADAPVLTYDTLPPPVPEIAQVNALDRALSVSVNSTGASVIHIEVRRAPAAEPTPDAGGTAGPDDGGSSLDAGNPSDAGALADAGDPGDGGTLLDAGLLLDAGDPSDAGQIADAGNVTDAGSLADAGAAPVDSGEEFKERVSFTPEVSFGRVTDLENGVTYEIRAIAEDGAGNRSAPSASVFAAPVQTDGFFSIYRKAGGGEQGGCSAIPGSTFTLLALWAASRVARKRTR